jgi:hypothetical protein
MVEVNIDVPTKIYTLHRPGCKQKPGREPKYKGFGTLKRDGGWLTFDTEAEARDDYQRRWQPRGYQWVNCSYCRP